MSTKPTVLSDSFANFFIIFAIISKYSFVFVCLISLAEAETEALAMALAQPLCPAQSHEL